MSSYEGRELLDGLRAMRAEIEKGDAKTLAKIANAETALARLGAEINNIHKRMQRPGAGVEIAGGSAPETEQAAARAYLDLKHLTVEAKAGDDEPRAWTSEQVDQAILARRAVKKILRRGEAALTPEYRKSLSSFSFGSNGFILPAEMSDRILSCLVLPTDITSLMGNKFSSSSSKPICALPQAPRRSYSKKVYLDFLLNGAGPLQGRPGFFCAQKISPNRSDLNSEAVKRAQGAARRAAEALGAIPLSS